MKYRVLDLLQSVPDGSQLRVARVTKTETVPFTEEFAEVKCTRFCALRNCPVTSASLTPQDCARCYSLEIVEGELVSDSGRRYPIVRGIPRLLSESTAGFLLRNERSFSLEWKYFRFGERNWGQDIAFRKRLFLDALGEEPNRLQGKVICDAGCGSGLLSMEMAKAFGMEVVALDLATGIEKAYHENKNPHVHFVQGSVLEPPLRQQVADYVYCAGVLVALPSPRAGFGILTKCLKPKGRCFIWLYHPLERHRKTGDYTREVLYDWIRRRVTSRLPIRLQEIFYLSLLPPYFLKRAIMNPFRNIKENRTSREKMQGFIDHFSPVFMHRNTEDDAKEWFREEGFENVAVAYNERYGFGIRGDRRVDAS